LPKAFEFAESFSKPAKLTLAGFQKWQALCCQLFKRALFMGNIFSGFKNQRFWFWPIFKNLGSTL
jgi:hypothetical protein